MFLCAERSRRLKRGGRRVLVAGLQRMARVPARARVCGSAECGCAAVAATDDSGSAR